MKGGAEYVDNGGQGNHSIPGSVLSADVVLWH